MGGIHYGSESNQTKPDVRRKDCKRTYSPQHGSLLYRLQRRGSEESIGINPGRKQHLLGRFHVCQGNYQVYNRDTAPTPEDKRKIELAAYDCDYFLTSANAITEDGIMINIDGHSNRVSSIAAGPRNVLMIIGMNKVTRDVDSAMSRARNEAAPINAQRFNLSTPCCKTGACFDCKTPDTICCQILITRYSKTPQRIKVILVNEDLGF